MEHTENEEKAFGNQQDYTEEQKQSAEQANNHKTDPGFDHNTSDTHMRIDEEGTEVDPEDQA